MSLFTKACFILSLIGYFCDVIGYISPFWFLWRKSSDDLVSQGLWQRCHQIPNNSYTCCILIDTLYDTTVAEFTEWRQAQLFIGLSLGTGLITFALFAINISRAFYAAFNVLNASLIGVGIYQYSIAIKSDPDVDEATKFISFYASTVSMIIFFIAAFVNRIQPQQDTDRINSTSVCQKFHSLHSFQKINIGCVLAAYFAYFWSFVLPIWMTYKVLDVDGNELVGYRGLFGECYTNDSNLCCRASNITDSGFEVTSVRILGVLAFVCGGLVILLTIKHIRHNVNFMLRLVTASLLITSCGLASCVYSSLLNITAGLFYLLSLMFLISDPGRKKRQTAASVEENNIPLDELCCVCLDKRINVKFERCGHSVCCTKCSTRIFEDSGKCPICRENIVSLQTRF